MIGQNINDMLNEIELELPNESAELRALKIKVELEERLADAYEKKHKCEQEEFYQKSELISKSMKPYIDSIVSNGKQFFCHPDYVNGQILSFLNEYVGIVTNEKDHSLKMVYMENISIALKHFSTGNKYGDQIQAILKKLK